MRSALSLALLLLALSACDSGVEGERLTIATLNLDRGASASAIAEGDGTAAHRLGTWYGAVRASDPASRAGRAALQLADVAPDAIALQEVLTVRSQYPSDWTPGADPNAETVQVETLSPFLDSLRARGLTYRVAAEAVTADWERPARIGAATVDLRVQEHVVLLVRDGLPVDDARVLPLVPREVAYEGAPVTFDAAAAMARIAGVPVATFRRSADDPGAAFAIADLLESLPATVVLAAHVGDASASETVAGTAAFTDAWDYLVGTGGSTCCNTESRGLDRRSDVIASRGGGLRFLDVRRLAPTINASFRGVWADLWVQ